MRSRPHRSVPSRGRVHTNGIENFWSLFKRAIKRERTYPLGCFTFRRMLMSRRSDLTTGKRKMQTDFAGPSMEFPVAG